MLDLGVGVVLFVGVLVALVFFVFVVLNMSL